MKGYRIAAMAVIGVLCCNTMAFAAPKPLEEAYEKNGNSYIKKTYVINNTERFLYKGIIIKHNKTEPTYTKTSLFLCEKRRFFMARTEKGVVTTI